MAKTARRIDKNGFLEILGCPISSFGIFDYSAAQVGLDGDPNRVVKVFRPESAVNSAEAIESFKNIPFIDDHEMLSGFEGDEENTAPEDYGIDGVLTSNVYFEDGWMKGDLKVFSRKLRRAIDSGKVDLSLGYDCDFIVQDGEWNGQPYEVIQTNLRGNHIALVDVGRVPGARVLDGRCFDHLSLSVVRPSDEGSFMKKTTRRAARDNAVEQLKSLLPALEQFLNEESQEPAHQGGEGENEYNEQPQDAMPNEHEEAAHQVAAEAEHAAAEQNNAAENEGEAAEADIKALVDRVRALCDRLEQEGGYGQRDGMDEGDDEDEDEDDKLRKEGKAEDVVHGLQEESRHHGASVEKDDEPTKNPKASPGPKSGANSMATDSALRAFYADSARKDSLYKRLSQVVGAFDHSAMDSKAVAKYGAKKLGIKCSDGAEFDALDNYLRGVEAGRKAARTTSVQHAADSAASNAELDAWIKGE